MESNNEHKPLQPGKVIFHFHEDIAPLIFKRMSTLPGYSRNRDDHQVVHTERRFARSLKSKPVASTIFPLPNTILPCAVCVAWGFNHLSRVSYPNLNNLVLSDCFEQLNFKSRYDCLSLVRLLCDL